jgi:hypothetical protein
MAQRGKGFIKASDHLLESYIQVLHMLTIQLHCMRQFSL